VVRHSLTPSIAQAAAMRRAATVDALRVVVPNLSCEDYRVVPLVRLDAYSRVLVQRESREFVRELRVIRRKGSGVAYSVWQVLHRGGTPVREWRLENVTTWGWRRWVKTWAVTVDGFFEVGVLRSGVAAMEHTVVLTPLENTDVSEAPSV
jgi:hypothetical protein